MVLKWQDEAFNQAGRVWWKAGIRDKRAPAYHWNICVFCTDFDYSF